MQSISKSIVHLVVLIQSAFGVLLVDDPTPGITLPWGTWLSSSCDSEGHVSYVQVPQLSKRQF